MRRNTGQQVRRNELWRGLASLGLQLVDADLDILLEMTSVTQADGNIDLRELARAVEARRARLRGVPVRSAVDDRRGHSAERAHAAGAPAGSGDVAAAPHELRLPDQLPGGVVGQQRRRVREAPRRVISEWDGLSDYRANTCDHRGPLLNTFMDTLRASLCERPSGERRRNRIGVGVGAGGALFVLSSRPA